MIGGGSLAIKSVKKAKRRIFVYYLGVFALLFALVLTVPNYLYQIYTKNRELQMYQKELVSLQNKEDELKTEVLQLQDPEYIAMIARQKYLFSKDGEWIIKIDKLSTVSHEVEESSDMLYYFQIGLLVFVIVFCVFLLFLFGKYRKKKNKQKEKKVKEEKLEGKHIKK